ncbi:MAG: hypothetical protein RML33_04245 [Acidobacteriota bacterium]|nr:hypothetical protein [Pyrinomonadaceae bacterium]MDW8304026.1 hypothetical protein [Acidobacteriota bacterium]
MRRVFHFVFLPVLIGFLFLKIIFGQIELEPERVHYFLLGAEERRFFLNLKEGDYAEIKVSQNDENGHENDEENGPTCVVYDPSGKDIRQQLILVFPEEWIGTDCQDFYFVAPETGKYIFTIKADSKSFSVNKERKFSLKYSKRLKLSANSEEKFRRIGDYTAKIVRSEEDFVESIFLLEKNGKLKAVSKGFLLYFGDDAYGGKKHANLIRKTVDKTGDGVPDIMLVHYSGGAHCCFDAAFIELGEEPRLREYIYTADARIIAIGKNPRGGLRFATRDYSFAYWYTSFASSPFPEVVLEFVDGKLRPNIDLMKKTKPQEAILKKKAAKARNNLLRAIRINKPRSCGDIFALLDGEGVVFWGEVLDLLYSGNDQAAWKYFDLVWQGLRQECKEQFKKKFNEQLLSSRFWNMILEERKKAKQ